MYTTCIQHVQHVNTIISITHVLYPCWPGTYVERRKRMMMTGMSCTYKVTHMCVEMLLWPVSSDEDDTADLLRELQKIKKERAEEQARKVCSSFSGLIHVQCMLYMYVPRLQERERKEEEERIRSENLLRGNPLLNQKQRGDFKIGRRSLYLH